MAGGGGKAGGAVRVFVSSTFIDNKARRKLVEDAIVTAGLVPVGMERFTAGTRPAVEECRAQVAGCHVLVGVLAYRYGWIPEGEERSITEIEYDTAVEHGLARLMFIIDESIKVDPNADFDQGPGRGAKQDKLDAFKAKVQRDQQAARFTEETLGLRVLQALGELGKGQGGGALAPTPRSIHPDELRAYLDKARSLYARVQLVGFDSNVRAALSLEDLYVPLDAVIDRKGRGRSVFESAQHAAACMEEVGAGLLGRDRVTLADAFGRAGKQGKRGLVLLGDPGSGKTTHLKQVLLKVIKDGPASIGLPVDTVPVFLSLRSLKDRSKGLQGLQELIQQELQQRMLCTAPDFGPRLCERGRLLLLLDGLDEVADAAERAEVARWIETAQLTSGGSWWFLVSCRYAGYTREVELDGAFLELHLRPMNDEQMQSFVEQWYANVEKAAYDDPQQAHEAAAERTKDLLEALSQREVRAVQRVYALTRNPLLLTAICLVHRDRGRLPHGRAQLYEEAIGVLLERWRTRLPERLTRDDGLELLRPVAAWMHERERERASKAELRAPVQQGLDAVRGVTMAADPFLESIRDHGGLLTGWGMDEYGFMHLGFQEYLAAQHLRNAGFRTAAGFDEIAGRFGESWWQEVILLMVALKNPSAFEELMRAVVRRPEFAEWAESETMQLCLREASQVSAAPFVELLTGDGEGERLPERMVAAAGVLAREFPKVLVGLGEVLAGYPVKEVRAWWAARQGGARVEVGEARVRVHERSGVELVRIEGGTFWMGSPEDEVGRDAYGKDDEPYLKYLREQLGFTGHPESPRHEVTVGSFSLARTPVTNAQYRRFLEATDRDPNVKEPEHWGDRQYSQDEQPVVGVSWDDAKAYCDWAGLVLPTEAQWEYACRAGTRGPYYGADPLELGWYGENSDNRLHAVGEKPASPWGLHDMHGNVFEWCRDALAPYRTRVEPLNGLRKEPVGDALRVVRGGSWTGDARYARAAYRGGSLPETRNELLGFRPAQVTP